MLEILAPRDTFVPRDTVSSALKSLSSSRLVLEILELVPKETVSFDSSEASSTAGSSSTYSGSGSGLSGSTITLPSSSVHSVSYICLSCLSPITNHEIVAVDCVF